MAADLGGLPRFSDISISAISTIKTRILQNPRCSIDLIPDINFLIRNAIDARMDNI